SLAGVKTIAAASPNDPAILLNLGWANYQAGRNEDAAIAWEATASRFPDSPYAVDALDVLYPGVAPGLPPIVVDSSAVPAKARSPPHFRATQSSASTSASSSSGTERSRKERNNSALRPPNNRSRSTRGRRG